MKDIEFNFVTARYRWYDFCKGRPKGLVGIPVIIEVEGDSVLPPTIKYIPRDVVKRYRSGNGNLIIEKETLEEISLNLFFILKNKELNAVNHKTETLGSLRKLLCKGYYGTSGANLLLILLKDSHINYGEVVNISIGNDHFSRDSLVSKLKLSVLDTVKYLDKLLEDNVLMGVIGVPYKIEAS